MKLATSFRIAVALTAVASLTGARDARADVKQECVDSSTEGQSLRDTGKLRAAHDRFTTCARDSCPSIVRKYCVDWLADVDRRLPTVVFRVRSADGADVAGAHLTVDGVDQPLDTGAPIQLDPGGHALHATLATGESVDQHVVIVEGEQGRVVVVRFSPAEPTPNAPAPKDPTPEAAGGGGVSPLTITAFVVAGLGLVDFTYFGLRAHGDLGNLRDTCAPYCASSSLSTVKTEALAADIGLGVGVVALGVAAYSLFTHREAPPTTSLIDFRARPGGGVIMLGSPF